jgi:cytochrome c5
MNETAVFFKKLKEIMSDAHNEHESVIRTPKQLVVAVAGFFLVIVIGIILLVSFATNTHTAGAGTDSQSAGAVNARIAPVAAEGFTLRDANAPKVLQSAEAVYTSVCAACHAAGLAGAPKIGDATAWGPRIGQGYETLLKHAVEGIRAMPAKGGNPDLDDVDVARAVVYMADKGGAKFKEPMVPDAKPVAATAAPRPPEAAPVSSAATTPPVAAPASATPALASANPGDTLYKQTCAMCHGNGLAGAPRFGDKPAWLPRLAQGTAVLYEHAIKGYQGKAGVMPPKGGSSAPDADVKAAVDYMLSAAK